MNAVRTVVLAAVAVFAGCTGATTGASVNDLDNQHRIVERRDFDKLWDYSKPGETEAKFREVLDAGGHDRAYVLELETQIARTYSLRNKIDEAKQLLTEVDGAITDADKVARIRYHLELGRAFNSDGDRELASQQFVLAWEKSRAAGAEFHAVDAAHMMAIVNADEMVEWTEKALAICEASTDKDTRDWRAALYNNLGWHYHDASDFERALQIFETTLFAYREKGKAKPILIARWSIARTMRSLDRCDEAIPIHRELLVEWQKLGEPGGFTHEELAECLLETGRGEESKPHFKKAHDALSKINWVEKDRVERLESLSE